MKKLSHWGYCQFLLVSQVNYTPTYFADHAEQLRKEAPGVLSWLVNGCLNWQQDGLNPPETVLAATNEYRKEEDTFGQFVDEQCIVVEHAEVKAGELYIAYKEWAIEYGLKPMSNPAFGKRMSARFEKFRRSEGFYYRGVGLPHKGVSAV